MNRDRLLRRLLQGSVNNVAYSDFIDLVEGFGFYYVRTRGSHRVYAHRGIPDQLHLQPFHGEAKSYQIRQFLHLIEQHNLRLEDA